MANDANEAAKSITVLGKRWKDIKRDYQSITDDKIGLRKVGAGLSGIFNGGLSDSDIKALRQYNDLISKGEDGMVAYSKALKNAGENAQKMAQNAQYAQVNVEALTTTEKIATATTQALSVAMNALLAFGAAWLVSKIVAGIQELTEAEEKAREASVQLREEADATIQSYQSEKQSLDSLVSEYITLYTTTSDLSSVKGRLLEIQKQINNEFVEGKDKVDLLNKSLKENLEITRQQAYLDSKSAEYKLRDEYTKANSRQNQRNLISLDNIVDSDLGERVSKELQNEANKAFIDYFNSVADAIEVESKNPVTGEVKTELRNRLDARGEILGLTSSGQGYAYDEYLRSLDLIIEKYEEWGKQSGQSTTKTLEDLRALRVEVDEIAKSDKSVISQYDEIAEFQSDYAKISAEQAEELDSVLTEAAQKINELNRATNLVDKFTISQEINDLRYEANQLAGDNVALTDSVTSVFDAYSQGFEDSLGDLESWRDAWFKTLDEIQKGGLKNVETMQNALATLVSGEGLSGDDMWKLIEFDSDGILTDIRQIGDKFYLNESQVVQLKDSYINKSIEQLKIENQLLTTKRQQTDADIIAYQNLLDKYNLTMLDAHNPRYTEYQQEYAKIQKNLDTANQKTKEYGDQIRYNNILIKQWGAGLGDTAAHQKELNNLVKELTDESDNLLNAYEGAFDIIIDGYEAEKKALEANKEELQEQLDLLQEQADLIQEQIDNYDKAAEAVKNAIKGEIDALKAQNEERESALDLAEKLANLENAKNNKVRTYTEAGGWQYEAKKADVEKAQREVDKAQTDQRIKALEEYLKKWEDLATKRQKEEDERLAAQILGADWREKIAKQDEDIFKQYEEEYDSYGEQLERISSIETSTVQKSLDNVNKQIAAKDKEIQKWQNYKSEVSSAAQTAKKEMSDWYTEALKIATDMGSDEGKVAGYLDDFYYRYKTILTNLRTYQDELNAAVNNFDPETLGEKFTEIADIDWDKVLDALKEYNRHINSESDARLHAEGYYADGGVASYTGLAMLHGSKQNPELILNAKDTAKLYNMIHNSPTLTPTAITGNMRIAQNLSAKTDTPNSVSVNVANLNLPNVANAEQFARQMESYMQTVLTESQVFKPRR